MERPNKPVLPTAHNGPNANPLLPMRRQTDQPLGRARSTQTTRSSLSTVRCARTVALASAILFWMLGASGCRARELRGYSDPSRDGRTFLVVDDDNGGHCGPILVDGQRWPHRIHALGAIAPGDHVIACGGQIQFRISRGSTFHFDYWGP